MKRIPKSELKRARMASFFIKMPLWYFLALIIAGPLGYWLKSWPLFIGLMLILPFFLNRRSVSKNVNILHDGYEKMYSAIKNELSRHDYYNTGEYSAIALDAENKLISVVSKDGKNNIQQPFKFSCEKILDYKAFSPSYITQKSASGVNDLQENLSSQGAAHAKSGLYFSLDDIMMPKVFVQMDYEEAEKWLLIFKKLLNNSLETQTKPMYYPAEIDTNTNQQKSSGFGKTLLRLLVAAGLIYASGWNIVWESVMSTTDSLVYGARGFSIRIDGLYYGAIIKYKFFYMPIASWVMLFVSLYLVNPFKNFFSRKKKKKNESE